MKRDFLYLVSPDGFAKRSEEKMKAQQMMCGSVACERNGVIGRTRVL